MNDRDLQHLAAIVRDSEDAIIGKTLDGIITSWNGGAERIYGYTAHEAIGRPIAMLVPPDRDDELPTILRRLTEGTGIHHYDTIRLTKDGRLVDISLTVSPIRDSADVLVGASSIARDVTKQKGAEAAARASARAYQLLMEQASDAILVSFPDQCLLEVNQRACEMIGYSREELLQLTENDIILPERLSALPPLLDEILAGKIVRMDRTMRRKDGTVLIAELSIRRLDDGRIVTIARDITERKLAETAIEQERRQLRQVIDTAPVAMALFDTEMRYIAHSAKWLTDNRLEGQALIGRVHDDFFPDLPARWKVIHQQALAGTSFSTSEDRYERADGSTVYVRWSIIPWRLAPGIIGGVILVTDRINELVEAREAALETARLKSEFVANLSHELRSPLAGVIGMNDLLLSTALTDEQRKFAQIVHESAQRQLALIEGLLAFSELETERLVLDHRAFDPRALVETTVDQLQLRAQEKHLDVHVIIAPELSPRLWGAPEHLRQVLFQLLDNAIKFTDRGDIVVRATVDHATASHETLRITVSDTGIGLSAVARSRLFQPFAQGDGSLTRRHGGTGLGLAMTKQLVELMGGAIDVQREQGHGSTFAVTVPLERVPATWSAATDP